MNEAEQGKRIVLPQWLPSRRAAEMREAHVFSGSAPNVDYEPSLDVFRDLLAEFRGKPSPFAATDLMGVAVVLGLQAEAEQLAEYVLGEQITGRAAQTQAKIILGRAPVPYALDERARIRGVKQRVAKFPRDAYAWIDQARLYTILGQYRKARRAVLIALNLAPSDRIVVRSAVRFFAHHQEWEDALYYAKRAYAANADPMILGPLLSIGTQLDKLPVRLRSASDSALKANDGFLFSEVLAAVGTFELLNGADKRSKKFFKRAWKDPAKAVVSQSQWVLREHLPGLAREQDIDFRQSAEAMSWLRFAVLDFEAAMTRAHEWVLEEPYSRAAHLHTSNTATLIDDFKTAVAAAERGLQANPGDLVLLNNLAFARLRSGDAAGGATAFEPVKAVLDDPKRVVEMATYGLLQMRLGDHAGGIAAYETAIARANQLADPKTALRAVLNLLISMHDICQSVQVDILEQAALHIRGAIEPQCIGTAMSLARRLLRKDFMKPDALQRAATEFIAAAKEGAGKLLSSLFAESVDKATSDEVSSAREEACSRKRIAATDSVK